MSTRYVSREAQEAQDALAALAAAADRRVHDIDAQLGVERGNLQNIVRGAQLATRAVNDRVDDLQEERSQLAPQTTPAQPPAPPAQGGNTATLPGDLRWDDQRPQARPPAGNPPAPVPPATAPQPRAAGRNPVNPRNWGPLALIAALVGAIVGLLVGLNWYPFAASGARRIVSEIFWTVGWVVLLGFLFGLIVDLIVQGYQENRRNH